MLVPSATVPPGSRLRCDVCIVGGGAAGITIANQLIDHRLRVILVAGGGMQPTESTQSLYAGVSTGEEYYPLDSCRIRAFGGTTHVWGGWIHPLDEEDFEERHWVAASGWPFPRAELAGAYARAAQLMEVDDDAWFSARARATADPDGRRSQDLDFPEVRFAIAPMRFGRAFREPLGASLQVEVLLDAHALAIEMSDHGEVATSVRVANTQGSRFNIEASAVVLAAGGLENPRILLESRGPGVATVGNAYGLVGRYFSDHLHVHVGTLFPRDPSVARSFEVECVGRGRVRRGLTVSREMRRSRRLLGSAVTLHNADDPHDVLSPALQWDSYRSMLLLLRTLRQRTLPEHALEHVMRVARDPAKALQLAYRRVCAPPPRRLLLGVRAEQSPNPESRVTLDESVDRYGMRRLRLDWRLSPQDLCTIRTTQELLQSAFVGERIELLPREGVNGWQSRIQPGAHHMGTTRMHRDPTRGVVDENCRVHGTRNLFVTGPSVFPTAGWAPPMMTVVALALRLADHLKRCHP